MSTATYAPRVPVHPDRMGAVKTSGPNLWVILHTSEGGEGVDSAEQLASFLSRPGDRPNGSGGRYGSSYHVIFDTDRVIPAVYYEIVAYSAGGGNAQGIHGCFPGKAGQTREQWLDDVSRAMIRQCAAWLVDIQAQFGIPVDRKMFPGEMLAGDTGLGDHFTVTEAFGKSTHTDVGPGFPWDVLFADIAALTAPTPPPPPPQSEGDSVLVNLIRLEGTPAVYAQYSGGYKCWVPDEATLGAHVMISGLTVTVIAKKHLGLWKSSGPILGPVPAGVDAWGVPK